MRIDKLNFQLEVVQKMHSDSLHELQENEGKLLDKSAYEDLEKNQSE